jgi:hypothetical protein
MFVFMDNIMKLQATIYIKLHSTNATAVRSRNNSEKETFDIFLTYISITSMQEEDSAVVTMFVYYNFQSLISPCCPVTVNRGELSRSDYVCVL